MSFGTTIRRLLWPKSLAGKSVIVGLVAATVLFGICATYQRQAAMRLADAWKLSEEFGPPSDLDSLFGEKIPDRENAAYPMETAAAIGSRFLTAERNRLKNPQDDLLIQDASYLAAMDRLLADSNYEQSLADADRRPGYHSLAQVAEALAFTNLTHLEAQRELVRAEQAIARRSASLGKREDAVRRLLRMSRLTRRWEEKEPFIFASLINISLRAVVMREVNLILRQGRPLPAVMHAEIELEVAHTEQFLRVLPRIAEFEKLMVANMRDNYPLPGLRVVNRFNRDDDLAFMICGIHSVARTYDRSYYLAKTEVDAYEVEILKLGQNRFQKSMHPGASFLMPALSMYRKAMDRIIALSRCLRIVNAMARKNEYAAALDSLGLPKDVLIDPFDGKPIRVKHTPNGPLIYSISYDLKDDGGDVRSKDVGLGSPETKPVTK